MNIWLRKKVPFYARHIRKKLFFRGNILIKYYSVNILRNNGVDNMTISKYHAYQPMVRMWFTGRFLEGLIFEVITVGLLRELSVSAHLKEIDLAGDCHKEFKRVHKHFLKRFAYLCR